MIGPEHADDPEDDPEYTIQADEEKGALVISSDLPFIIR